VAADEGHDQRFPAIRATESRAEPVVRACLPPLAAAPPMTLIFPLWLSLVACVCQHESTFVWVIGLCWGECSLAQAVAEVPFENTWGHRFP